MIHIYNDKCNLEIVALGREVFKKYKELEKIGLAAPQVTYLMHELKNRGMDVDENAITINEAGESIIKALKRQ